jgi:hypothetical protein
MPSQRGHMPPARENTRFSVVVFPAPFSIVIAPAPLTDAVLKENALGEPSAAARVG